MRNERIAAPGYAGGRMDGWTLARSCARCAPALPDVLVAVDFDGTLAPLVPDPETSSPVAGADRRAGRAGRPGCADRGRSPAARPRTAVRLGGLDRDPRDRRRGPVRARDGGRTASWTARTPGRRCRRCRTGCPSCCRRTTPTRPSGSRTSGSRWSCTRAGPPIPMPPWRRCTPRSRRSPTSSASRCIPDATCSSCGVPGYDKAGALRELAGDHAGVLYLGDDLGDLPAFAEIGRLRAAGRTAYSVAVLSSGVPDVVGAADRRGTRTGRCGRDATRARRLRAARRAGPGTTRWVAAGRQRRASGWPARRARRAPSATPRAGRRHWPTRRTGSP